MAIDFTAAPSYGSRLLISHSSAPGSPMSPQKRLRLLVRHFHENGLKFLLENPGNVHDLLQLLQVQLLPRIDFSQMRVVPGRFVQRDFRHLESDLVLRAPVQPPPGTEPRQLLLYILIEHQSEPDRFMPLRVLEYVVMIYKRQLREWEKEHGNLDHCRLQPVLPIVLYTGTRTWNQLGSIWELVDLGDELAQRIPELEPLFLNVGQTSEHALEQGGLFGLLLRLVQRRRTRLRVFEQTLRQVVSALEALADADRLRWLELLSYVAALIYNEREVAEREPLLEQVTDSVQNDKYRQEVFDMGKTIAESLREEGEQKGELRTQRRCLVRLLRNRFGKLPAATVRRIEATERLELLERWFDQASSAKSLEDVSFTAE
jgi:Putative transposase, YhgA-like